MRFFNPLAFWGLISIPIILLIYLVKPKPKEIIIPSTKLWKQVLKTQASNSHLKKLKKDILILLQILAVLFCIITMAKPYIPKVSTVQSYIIVLDSSLSMQATDKSPNRFEYAKQQIYEFIQNLKPDSKISLIVSNENPYILFNFVDSKNISKDLIKSLEVSDTVPNLEMTSSLLEMLNNQNESNIYIFSDNSDYKLDNLDYNTVLIGDSIPNTAITLLSHSISNNQISALVTVKNYGTHTINQAVSLYADDALYDTVEITLTENEEEVVLFDNINLNTNILEARLDDKDNLKLDNYRFDIINTNAKRKVLLSTQNRFLEKALSILDIELYKCNPTQIEDLSGYDLYIFDGVIPKIQPQDGHIFIINPPNDNEFIKVGDQLDVNNIIVKDKKLLEFINDIEFQIAKTNQIEVPVWADIIIDSESTPLILAGNLNNQKRIIINFDLNNTDLPLKKEFPILIYNLVNWFIPENLTLSDNIICGDTINLELKPNILSAKIITPNNKIVNLNPQLPFADTLKAGIYILEQTLDNEILYNKFVVNIETSESNLLRDNNIVSMSEHSDLKLDKNLSNLFLNLMILSLILEFYLYARNQNKVNKKILSLRGLTLIILILAQFNFSLKIPTAEATTILLADLSDSMKYNDIESIIDEAIKTNDSIKVIEFGKYASVRENLLDKADNKIDKGLTDISGALKLASVIMPENTSKQLVLISDGEQNYGDSLKQARLLKEKDIELAIYKLDNKISEEVQITEIEVPRYVNQNRNLDIVIKIDSLNDTKVNLKLYKNNSVIANEALNLNKGQNRFIINDYSATAKSISYKAEIEPLNDTFKQNNRAYAYTTVSDITKILIVDNKDSGLELEKLLKASELSVVRQASAILLNDLNSLVDYNAVILADISVDMVSPKFLESLESFVKEMGGGLFVVGGQNSYALGGYKNTVLEKLLPVYVDLKTKSNQADLGMIIVTDRSGSMDDAEYGISKLSLAKESAIRALDSMQANDSLGILAFDTEPIWISEFQKLEGNTDKIKSNIASITAGGGTSILPSLELAYEKLVASDTKLKHIILLTDGQAENSGYDNIISKLNEAKITLSTVSIGQNSDKDLLKNLAESTNGRYYHSTVFTDLPEIFARETTLAGKSYINKESFYPKLNSYSSIVENIVSLPKLNGYISSVAKPRSDTILVSNKNEPILASWQYGLGKVFAWTSDLNGNWSFDWLSSNEGIQIIRNVISLISNNKTGKAKIIDEISNTQNNIEVTLKDSNLKSIKGTILNPNNEKSELKFKLTSPKLYTAEFENDISGIYIINIQAENQIGETEIINSSIAINYSPEYDLNNFFTGDDLLNKLANLTDGTILTSLEQLSNLKPKKSYSEKNLQLALLILSLILLLLEIAFRRFEIFSIKLDIVIKQFSSFNKPSKQLKSNSKPLKATTENVKKSNQTTASLLAQNKKKRNGR